MLLFRRNWEKSKDDSVDFDFFEMNELSVFVYSLVFFEVWRQILSKIGSFVLCITTRAADLADFILGEHSLV